MGSPGTTLTSNRNEKFGVSPRYCEVVVDNRERRHDVVDEVSTPLPGSPLGQLHPNKKLGQRYSCHGDVVVVVDYVVEIGVRPFRVNQKCRIKK